MRCVDVWPLPSRSNFWLKVADLTVLLREAICESAVCCTLVRTPTWLMEFEYPVMAASLARRPTASPRSMPRPA